MIRLTDNEKKLYEVFYFLRNKLPLVDDCNLLQASFYMVRMNGNFNIETDLTFGEFNDENHVYELLLSNGSKITFQKDALEQLGFSIEKSDDDLKMCIFTSSRNNDSYIHGEIDYNDYLFTIGTTTDQKNGFIETEYLKNNNRKSISYFNIQKDDFIESFDNNIISIILMIELLYTNLQNVKQNKLVRTK